MSTPRTEFTRDLTETDWSAFIPAHYLNVNLVDPGTDLDGSIEFCDSTGTDDLRGLTVREFDSILDAVRFLNGYDI